MSTKRGVARWTRQHRIAERAAALTMVGTFEMLGLTRRAAIGATAARLEVSARSVWRWLDWAGAEIPSTYTLECLGALPEDLR